MKKLLLLTPTLIALTSFYAVAQKTVVNNQNATTVASSQPLKRMEPAPKNDGTPVVTIGTIESGITSREKVLAYPRLLAQELNCEVTGYTCTISCDGKTYGPFTVKGAVFNDDIKDRVKALEAPPKVKIAIDNIRVKCNGGEEVAAKPINVEYDH